MPSVHYNEPRERESDDHRLLGLQDIQAANAAKIPTCAACGGNGPFMVRLGSKDGYEVKVERLTCVSCFDKSKAARMKHSEGCHVWERWVRNEDGSHTYTQEIHAVNKDEIPTCDFCHGFGPFIHGVECPNGDAVVVSRKLCFKCFDSVTALAAHKAEVATGGKEELPF